MEILLWTAHISLAIILIVLVLLQHGKGADMGAAFGSGSAGSLFGASGSATFLSRATGLTAAIFFTTSMSLTYLSANPTNVESALSVMDRIEESEIDVRQEESNSAYNTDPEELEDDGKSIVDRIPE